MSIGIPLEPRMKKLLVHLFDGDPRKDVPRGVGDMTISQALEDGLIELIKDPISGDYKRRITARGKAALDAEGTSSARG